MLDSIDMHVTEGEIHALVGESGAGKSTLLRIIAGLDTPDKGRIRFDGAGIAIAQQEPMVFPEMTVAENMSAGREPTRWLPGLLDRRAMREDAARKLEAVGAKIEPDRRMGELSAAEQRWVEIAKALGAQAELVLLDEATSPLGAQESERLLHQMAGLRDRGVTVIFVSRRMEEVLRIADTITVLRDGRHAGSRAMLQLNEAKVAAMMVGHEALGWSPKLQAVRESPALEVRGLSRFDVYRQIRFHVQQGEIVGLAGLENAGWREIVAAMIGVEPAEEGEIFAGGRRVRIDSPADALASGIAMVTGELVPKMSVAGNMMLSSPEGMRVGPFRRGRAERDAAKALLGGESLDEPVESLNRGGQRKVALSRGLVSEAAILILDEPTEGADVGTRREIHGRIAEAAATGKAILLITSDMNELLSLSHRVMVMRRGVIAAELDPTRTSAEEILGYAMRDEEA